MASSSQVCCSSLAQGAHQRHFSLEEMAALECEGSERQDSVSQLGLNMAGFVFSCVCGVWSELWWDQKLPLQV